jgi:cytochrome bd ubiquinol oxidase subunit II
MDLNLLWFVLLGVLLTGYAILDGFDLGVGILHLAPARPRAPRLDEFHRPALGRQRGLAGHLRRRAVRRLPARLCTAFSGFYLAFMVAAVRPDLPGGVDGIPQQAECAAGGRPGTSPSSLASTLATFLFGVAVGNAMIGLPIGADMEFARARLARPAGPFPLLVGVFAVATFAMHGSIYLYLKTEGELQQRIHGWMWTTFGIFLVLYLFTTIFTLVQVPSAVANFRDIPWAGLWWC